MDLLSWPLNRFSVVLDGVKVGDIWPRQIKIFQCPPGNHRLRLDWWGFLRRSRELDVSIASGEEKSFVCFTNVIGYVAVRPATPKDVAGMERWKRRPMTPRNGRG
jgi:hypothetical protein